MTILRVRRFFVLGSVSGFLAVALGAFGAHELKDILGPEERRLWDTAFQYHALHALALLGVAWAASQWPRVCIQAAGWLFVVGTLLFSGSLYTLSLVETRWFGVLTPIGGLCFLVGWLSLAWGAWQGD